MSKKYSSIKDIVLAVTYQCNSRCSFCDIWKKNDSFCLEPRLYSNLPKFVRNINISGGEPFLRDDLADIIGIIAEINPKARIIISTNGFLTERIIGQMKEIIKIKSDIGVAVSLDGLKEAHEKLRGIAGGYDRLMETVKQLKDMGVKNLKFGFTLGDDNISELKKVYNLSKQMGLEFSLTVRHNSEHYFGKSDNQFKNIKQIEEVLNWLIKEELKGCNLKKWLRAYFAYGALKFIKTNKRILSDYSGVSSLFIDPYANIYPSDVWNLKLGEFDKVENWAEFSKTARQKIKQNKGPASWMICTAREAMRKHWVRVGLWVAGRKIANTLRITN